MNVVTYIIPLLKRSTQLINREYLGTFEFENPRLQSRDSQRTYRDLSFQLPHNRAYQLFEPGLQRAERCSSVLLVLALALNLAKLPILARLRKQRVAVVAPSPRDFLWILKFFQPGSALRLCSG